MSIEFFLRAGDPARAATPLLAIAVLWMGLFPKPFTDVMHHSVTELLKHVATSKLPV